MSDNNHAVAIERPLNLFDLVFSFGLRDAHRLERSFCLCFSAAIHGLPKAYVRMAVRALAYCETYTEAPLRSVIEANSERFLQDEELQSGSYKSWLADNAESDDVEKVRALLRFHIIENLKLEDLRFGQRGYVQRFDERWEDLLSEPYFVLNYQNYIHPEPEGVEGCDALSDKAEDLKSADYFTLKDTVSTLFFASMHAALNTETWGTPNRVTAAFRYYKDQINDNIPKSVDLDRLYFGTNAQAFLLQYFLQPQEKPLNLVDLHAKLQSGASQYMEETTELERKEIGGHLVREFNLSQERILVEQQIEEAFDSRKKLLSEFAEGAVSDTDYQKNLIAISRAIGAVVLYLRGNGLSKTANRVSEFAIRALGEDVKRLVKSDRDPELPSLYEATMAVETSNMKYSSGSTMGGNRGLSLKLSA